MKVTSSPFLTEKRPLLDELLHLLLDEYKYASLLAVDSMAKNYQVSASGVTASESGMLSSRGFVARVFDGESCCEYSFNELSEELLPVICSRIRDSLVPLVTALPDGITVMKCPPPPDEPAVLERSTEYDISPEDMGDEDIIAQLTRVREAGMACDERILDFRTMCSYQRFSKIFISHCRRLEQNIMWTTGSVMAMAQRGEEIKDYYKGYSKLGGVELLSEMEKDVSNAAHIVIELLDSSPIPPGEYDCICTPEVTGMIVHEAFGHGVEMDMFVKKRAQAEQFVGQYVASPLVTMHDGASVAQETGTYFFDDEGVLAHDTVIIDKGILKRGINDTLSAMRLNAPQTGNGRRESYERKAYTRMTNTYFESGVSTYDEMLASIKDGFLIENASSGMEDPKNWGIQCMVNIAREIKDGQLTGRVFSPIVLTGYVPDLLRSITMMSADVHLGGGGFCGKGYKEWVKVSDGGPYIKARIRLG